MGTGFGNYNITIFCAEHCGCNQSEEEVNTIIKAEVDRRFTASYKEACTFATGDCKSYLSNMYTCAEETNSGKTEIDSAVRDVLKFDEGSRYTLEMAKLGNEALQRFQTFDMNVNIQRCSRDELILMDIEASPEWEAELEQMSSSDNYRTVFASAIFSAATSVLFLNLY